MFGRRFESAQLHKKKDITYDVFFFVELTSFFERLIPLTPDASGITPVGYPAPFSRGPPALIISWYDVQASLSEQTFIHAAQKLAFRKKRCPEKQGHSHDPTQ